MRQMKHGLPFTDLWIAFISTKKSRKSDREQSAEIKRELNGSVNPSHNNPYITELFETKTNMVLSCSHTPPKVESHGSKMKNTEMC